MREVKVGFQFKLEGGKTLVGNVMAARRRLAAALDTDAAGFPAVLRERLRHPVAPIEVPSSQAPVHEVVVTNSLPLSEKQMFPNLHVVSVAPLLGEAIKRIHRNESVSYLFD